MRLYLAQQDRAGHQVDGELVVALEQVPPGLDVGDVVGVADGPDLARRAPCQSTHCCCCCCCCVNQHIGGRYRDADSFCSDHIHIMAGEACG